MVYTHQHNKTGNILLSELHCEIEKSTISKDLDWVTVKENWNSHDVFCSFIEEPSVEEKTLLETIIDDHPAIAHDGEDFLIYDNIQDESLKQNKKVPPVDLHYGALNFDKEKTFEKWLIKTIKYWQGKNLTTGVYYWLALREDNEYVRDINDNIEIRHKDIIYYRKDWTTSDPERTEKTYTKKEGIAVDEIARSNILSDIKFDCVWLVALTEWLDEAAAKLMWLPFVSSLALEMQQFRDGDRQPLINAVNADTTYVWLDNTNTGIPNWQWGTMSIRQYVVYSITA